MPFEDLDHVAHDPQDVALSVHSDAPHGVPARGEGQVPRAQPGLPNYLENLRAYRGLPHHPKYLVPVLPARDSPASVVLGVADAERGRDIRHSQWEPDGWAQIQE